MSELIGTPKVTDIDRNIANWIACVYRRTDDLHVGQDRIMTYRGRFPILGANVALWPWT